MKALQHHPRICTREKKEEIKDRSVKISPTVGPVPRLGYCRVLLVTLSPVGRGGGHRPDQSVEGPSPEEVLGKNPQNTKYIWFMFTQVQVGMPRYLPYGRSFTLGDVVLWIMGHFGSP